MKLSQTNKFNGGMLKDIEPLMTPDTVMTDCLNGTLITYNGNEYALQTDMGNYAFKNGALSNGFVPVGMKEHQGVLYIISYNPLDDQVEIGSFPSQKTIFTPVSSDGEETPVKDIELVSQYNFYADLEKGNRVVLFSREAEFFLNPGDKYLIVYNGANKEFKELIDVLQQNAYWKQFVPYVLTEDNKLYDISGYLEIQPAKMVENRDDYIPISWDIPGWLAIKMSVAVPEQFTIYWDSSYANVVQKSSEGIIEIYQGGDLKVQTYWNGARYTQPGVQPSIEQNLVYFLHDTDNIRNELPGAFCWDPSQKTANQTVSYNKFQAITHNTISAQDINNDSKSYGYITPALKVDGKYIVYDQFTQPIKCGKVTIDTKDIKVGEHHYKYYVDENSVTVSIDYESYSGVALEYRASRYTLTDNQKPHYIGDWTEIADGSTNSVIYFDIPYDIVQSEDDIKRDVNEEISLTDDSSVARFNKEDIYFLEFRYHIKINNGEKNDGSQDIVGKIAGDREFRMYATELVNYWYYIKANYAHLQFFEILNRFSDVAKLVMNPDYLKITPKDSLHESNDSGEYVEIIPYKANDMEGKSTLAPKIKITNLPNIDTNLYNNPTTSKKMYKQGITFSITPLGDYPLYTFEKPKDQYGNDGRMWRGIGIEELGSGNIIDSRGRFYPIKIEKEALSFEMFNLITITNNEDKIDRTVSTQDKYLFDNKTVINKSHKLNPDTFVLSFKPELGIFHKDDDRRDWKAWYTADTKIWDVQFNAGEQKLYLKGESTELTPDRIYAKFFKDIDTKKLETFGNEAVFMAKCERAAARGNLPFEATSQISRLGFCTFNFLNWRGKSQLFESDAKGGRSENKRSSNFGVCFPSTEDNGVSYSVVYYPHTAWNGHTHEDMVRDYSQSLYCYLMMCFCVRVCISTAVSQKYYSTFSYKTTSQDAIYVKSIRITGDFKGDYYMKDIDPPETINTDYEDYDNVEATVDTTIPLPYEYVVPLDSVLLDILDTKIEESQNAVRDRVNVFTSRKEVKSQEIYLIDEYDESKNQVKLSEVITTLQYNGSQVLANPPMAINSLRMRATDNHWFKIAAEYPNALLGE